MPQDESNSTMARDEDANRMHLDDHEDADSAEDTASKEKTDLSDNLENELRMHASDSNKNVPSTNGGALQNASKGTKKDASNVNKNLKTIKLEKNKKNNSIKNERMGLLKTNIKGLSGDIYGTIVPEIPPQDKKFDALLDSINQGKRREAEYSAKNSEQSVVQTQRLVHTAEPTPDRASYTGSKPGNIVSIPLPTEYLPPGSKPTGKRETSSDFEVNDRNDIKCSMNAYIMKLKSIKMHIEGLIDEADNSSIKMHIEGLINEADNSVDKLKTAERLDKLVYNVSLFFQRAIEPSGNKRNPKNKNRKNQKSDENSLKKYVTEEYETVEPAKLSPKTSYADKLKKNLQKKSNNKKTADKPKENKPSLGSKNMSKKKPVKLNDEQIGRILDGKSPFKPSEYKFVYFDGFKRNRVVWVKQILAKHSVNMRNVGNIAWVNDSRIELCVNSK
ncbi:hypothetical protein BB561_001857 [Smittium simulii]|uniref:Uncharacterized protein n=1 Tax=Smittium simulii TaxID=133385 RepID=A0A2T9YSK7_9FUNG|nr:hypothetical protein BB561_001857 [Smittium simulii]